MNILIIGSGGREHALAWQAARSRAVVMASGRPREVKLGGSADAARPSAGERVGDIATG